MNEVLLNLKFKIGDLFFGEEGQDLIEYALMIALISIALIASIQGVATSVSGLFNTAAGIFG